MLPSKGSTLKGHHHVMYPQKTKDIDEESDGYEEDEEDGMFEEDEEVFGWEGGQLNEQLQAEHGCVTSLVQHRLRRERVLQRIGRRAHRNSHSEHHKPCNSGNGPSKLCSSPQRPNCFGNRHPVRTEEPESDLLLSEGNLSEAGTSKTLTRRPPVDLGASSCFEHSDFFESCLEELNQVDGSQRRLSSDVGDMVTAEEEEEEVGLPLDPILASAFFDKSKYTKNTVKEGSGKLAKTCGKVANGYDDRFNSIPNTSRKRQEVIDVYATELEGQVHRKVWTGEGFTETRYRVRRRSFTFGSAEKLSKIGEETDFGADNGLTIDAEICSRTLIEKKRFRGQLEEISALRDERISAGSWSRSRSASVGDARDVAIGELEWGRSFSAQTLDCVTYRGHNEAFEAAILTMRDSYVSEVGSQSVSDGEDFEFEMSDDTDWYSIAFDVEQDHYSDGGRTKMTGSLKILNRDSSANVNSESLASRKRFRRNNPAKDRLQQSAGGNNEGVPLVGKGAKDVKAGSPGHSGGRESPRGRTRRSLWDLGRNRPRTPPRATSRGETGTPESLSASGLVSQDSGCASGAESINLEDCKEPSRAKSPRRTVPQVRNGNKNGSPAGCESLSVSQLVSQDSGCVSGADSINLDDPAVSLDLSDSRKSKLTPSARSVARNTDRNASTASSDVLSVSSLVSQDSGCVSGAESMVLDDPEVSGEPSDSRIGKTVPKLERRYSFEYEDGSLFVSGTSPPEKTVTSTPVAKEKPVKPLRKKVVPKPGSPAGLKRRVPPATPAESEGINSIFNPRGKAGLPLGSKSQKVVRAGGEREGRLGNAVADQRKPLVKGAVEAGTSGKTFKPSRDKLENSPNARQSNGGAIRKSGNTARSTTVSADGGAAQVGGNRSAVANKPAAVRIPKEARLADLEPAVLGLPDAFLEPKITVDDASIESDVIKVDDKAVGQRVALDNADERALGLGAVEEINEVCCDISSSRGSCSRDPGKSGSPGNGDGGTIDDCDIVAAPASEPQMLSTSLTANSLSSRGEHINREAESFLVPSTGARQRDHGRTPDRTMYVDERISSLGSSPQGGRPVQCYHFTRDKLCNEFGDVSEDIGLDRLNALYGMRALDGGDASGDLPGPGTPLSNQNNNEVYRYAGNFNLQGEFGDVTEDLGAGRFPSLPSDGSVISDASGHSYGVYVSHFEDDEDEQNGVVRRNRKKSDVNACVGVSEEDFSEGLTHSRVGHPGEADFPAFPVAVTGMEAEDIEDGYEYDEDYATCVEEGPSLDEELILEVLCANRVSQMTRTYNDIEAVSRLLEEKEKDLELTARIGKELLDQNQGLKARLAALEVEIRTAHEGNTQIRHELQQKTQLLHALTSDEDGSLHDHASPLTSPSDPNLPPLPSGSVLGSLGGKSSARASVELLKRRVSWLEDENKSLRMEASQLARETQRVEEEEAKLVEGVAQQLASVSEESRMLSEELERVRTEGGRHREEVDILLEKLAAAQEEIRRLRQENEELSSMVIITRENQDRLTTELADFKERHGEVMCLLNEAQENLRKMRQKELPSALSGNRYLIPPITTHHGYLNHFGDSIASELESSLNSELSLDSGIHMPDMQGRVPHYRKVFETVRSASRSSNSPSPSPLHRMPSNSSLHHQQLASSSFAQLSTTATLSSSSMQTCRVSARPAASMGDDTGSSGYRNSFSDVPKHLYGGGIPTAGFYSLDSAGQSEESDQSGMVTDSDECLYPRNANMSGRIRTGVPGSPGAKELQAALVQMAKQEHPTLTKGEKSIGGYEGKSRGSSLDVGPHRWSMSSVSSTVSVCHALPYGCRTPDSIMSTGSSRGSRSSWRMPEKLQIVKPREGSLTLGWWSRLATPSLSAALEERPGVKVRGGVNDSIQQHTLMDLEEDDSMSVASGKTTSKTSAPIHPGKFFQGTASVYTYTNSTVLHPDNVSCVPPSPMPQSPAPMSPTQQQQTPNLLSRRSSISTATPTFSTALGLAKMLHERGISASSSENDLSAQAHFTSATATPCNSPDESPFSSRSPSPDGDEFDPNPIASLISSGAELLRRSLGGGTLPPPSGALQRSSRGRSLKRNSRPPIGSLSRSDRKALAGMKLVEKLERIGLESIMAYSQPLRPFQGLVPLTTTLQVGTMYARPAVKSPMAQLTSLKSTLRSRSTESHEDELDGPSPAKQKPKPCRRQDLGTVPTVKKAALDPLQAGPGGARGTISAIFFGRKGGLM